jgi:hypothetical protein
MNEQMNEWLNIVTTPKDFIVFCQEVEWTNMPTTYHCTDYLPSKIYKEILWFTVETLRGGDIQKNHNPYSIRKKLLVLRKGEDDAKEASNS